jgi:hypothetical protein
MFRSATARRAASVLIVATAIACLQPSSALAHAGLTAPVATSYLAKVAHVPPGLQAKVVDGDQQLWLRASPSVSVVVTGLRGEPYLRFLPSGVWVNERSPTTYLNKPRPQVAPPSAIPGATPQWKRISTAHSYRWHEDRLHSLAATARTGAARYVGAWTVPLTIGGRATRITGGLWYAPNPSILWFWPLLVGALCSAALLRVRSPEINRLMAATVTSTTLVAVIVAHAGRGFYGRPTVGAGQLVEFCIYSAIALGGIWLLLSPKWFSAAPGVAGVVGITVALGFLPVLTRGFVLSALPATVQRIAVSAALAGGISALVVLLFGEIRNPEPRPNRQTRRAQPKHDTAR